MALFFVEIKKQGARQNPCSLHQGQQQGARQHASPQHQGQQLGASQSASQHQGKPHDAIMKKGSGQWGNKELIDLIEAIPYYDQFINSIQGMMPHGLEAVK
nr:hypothetical protein CFP56_15331 [Quercus suber]